MALTMTITVTPIVPVPVPVPVTTATTIIISTIITFPLWQSDGRLNPCPLHRLANRKIGVKNRLRDGITVFRLRNCHTEDVEGEGEGESRGKRRRRDREQGKRGGERETEGDRREERQTQIGRQPPSSLAPAPRPALPLHHSRQLYNRQCDLYEGCPIIEVEAR